ncbi:substrate-binding domain-containing protein [Bifidobacterium longum]|uniref:substrate-binding domain-containing protein n=1 Tax=Bifidobacterium longum TaxID=216816 RepID=UPI002F42E76C
MRRSIQGLFHQLPIAFQPVGNGRIPLHGPERCPLRQGFPNREKPESKAALQKNGISADPHLIKVGDYASDKAYKAACDLLEMREQDRPTAIFAFNDLGAINVYRAARQHGISLPEQLSIIGFDDVYPAASMCPSLTTIRQPFDLIARQCIDLILEAREGKVEQNYFIFPTQLVERESCVSPARP